MVTNLITIFRDHYEYFAQQPELSKLMLREMLFYDSGEQANRFKSTREHFLSLISESIGLAAERGEIASKEDHGFIGWVVFCLYQVEIRRWLAEGDLNVTAGIASLERAIRLVVSGLSAPSQGQVSRAAPTVLKHKSGKTPARKANRTRNV